MSRRPGKRPGPLRHAGDPQVHGGFHGALIEHLAFMSAMHLSGHTIKNRRIDLGYFIDWCEERSIARPDEVTRALLERYRQHVFHYRRQRDGRPLSFNTQQRRLIAVRQFFRWLTRAYQLSSNPASELELPRAEQRLPRHVLNVAEIEQVINAVDLKEPSGRGVRDRAMLETLYSTGMRRAELVGVRVDDLDLREGTLFIRLGKGKKDRLVPIGERASAWIERYLYTVRPHHLEEADPEVQDAGVLFLAQHGGPMQPKQLSKIVKGAITAANLERFRDTHPNAACHLFRHACATHMLENGADIRYIQALLGHSHLSATEVYTRVSIGKLKAVHAQTHPARLHREGEREDIEQERPP